MWTVSPHVRVWGECLSASEQIATLAIPISRQVRAMRTAISPRLAMSSFRMGKLLFYWFSGPEFVPYIKKRMLAMS